MIFRRAITWEAVDWLAFLRAGGAITVEAWERATPASRAACLLAREALAAGTVETPSRPAPTALDALREEGAAIAADALAGVAP